jgi:hypothetical protein
LEKIASILPQISAIRAERFGGGWTSWDRSVMIRVSLLRVSVLAQIIALSGNLGASS